MFRSPRLFQLSSFLLVTFSVSQGLAQGKTAVNSLEFGKPVETSIAAPETQSYSLTLTSGEYAQVVVDQRGVDLVVSFYGPDGGKIVQMDGPNYNHGFELLSLVAESAGTYRLEVQPRLQNASGRYEVRLNELREANAQDRNRIAAQQKYVEAKVLRNQRTAGSYQQ